MWRPQPIPLGSTAIVIECADLQAARRDVTKRIRLLLNQEAGWAKFDLNRYVQITAEDGEELAIVTFREAASVGDPID